MAVQTTKTNKPFNPRGNDQSPKGYNRAALYSGKALDFDGVNDYVDLDGFTLSGTTATFVFNLKMDDWIDNKFIFDADNQRLVIGTGDIGNEIGLYDSTAWKMFGTISDTTNTNNFAIVIDGTTAKCFLNGQSFGTDQTITNIDLSNPSNVALGSRNDGLAYFLNGQMAGFKVFNTALTAAQVADLYNNPEKVVPTGVDNTALKLWLPMQEGAGTTAYDGSGNGNHGTISGATYVNGIGAPVAQTAVIDWNKGINLGLYSEDFGNANWLKLNSSVSTDVIDSPQGLTNADKIVENSATATGHTIYYSKSVTSGSSYTFSVFVKSAERTKVWMDFFGGANVAVFDLTNGNVLAQSGSGLSANSEDFGNGWYRCSITQNAVDSTLYPNFGPTINSTTSNQYDGDGTSGIYAWGAQLNAGSVAPYVPTIGSAQTSPVLLPQGLTSGRDITGVNLFENVRKQGALNLDGNSWAEVHDNASLDITGHITLEAWVKIKDGMSADGVLGRWAASLGYLLYLNASNDIRFYVNGLDTRYTSLTNGWRHIVGLYNGSAKKLYVDGAEVSSSSQTVGAAASTAPIEIGRYQQSTGNTIDGPIAQPRIYNRALTAEEVQRNFDAGKNTYTN